CCRAGDVRAGFSSFGDENRLVVFTGTKRLVHVTQLRLVLAGGDDDAPLLPAAAEKRIDPQVSRLHPDEERYENAERRDNFEARDHRNATKNGRNHKNTKSLKPHAVPEEPDQRRDEGNQRESIL